MFLKFLSWNLSAWDVGSQHTQPVSVYQKHMEILKIITDSNADILCLQECDVLFIGRLRNIGTYQLLDQVQSHCQYTTLFVKSNLSQQISGKAHVLDGAVYADLKAADTKKRRRSQDEDDENIVVIPDTDDEVDQEVVRISSMHLAPFKDGDQERLHQWTKLMNEPVVKKGTRIKHFVVAGDANVRQPEVKTWLSLDTCRKYGLYDAKTKASGQLDTWNLFVNKYHGDRQYQIKCCFDRVFLSSGVQVEKYQLIGDTKYKGGYLSDHFGILCRVSLSL